MTDGAKKAQGVDQPVKADFMEVTPELREMIDGCNLLMPQINKLRGLVESGWLAAEPGEMLIDAAIREITTLRAEAAPPPTAPNLPELLVGAFSAMCEQFRATLPAGGASIQQLRYNAFAMAVAGILPAIRAGVNMEALANLSGALRGQVEHCTGLMAISGAGGVIDQGKHALIEAERTGLLTAIAFIDVMVAGGSITGDVVTTAQHTRVRRAGLAPEKQLH